MLLNPIRYARAESRTDEALNHSAASLYSVRLCIFCAFGCNADSNIQSNICTDIIGFEECCRRGQWHHRLSGVKLFCCFHWRSDFFSPNKWGSKPAIFFQLRDVSVCLFAHESSYIETYAEVSIGSRSKHKVADIIQQKKHVLHYITIWYLTKHIFFLLSHFPFFVNRIVGS